MASLVHLFPTLSHAFQNWLPSNRLFFPFAIVLTAVVGKRIINWLRAPRLLFPLPPGPPTNWLNGPAKPYEHSWRNYDVWAEEYGELVYFSHLGNKVLVLNSYEAFIELFEKRGEKYASRPVRTMVVDVLGFDFMITTMTLGEKFKRHRYLFHKYFKRLEHSKYNGAQLIQVNVFLRDLLKEPESFRTLIHRSSAAVVLRMLYGHDVATDGDKYVELAAQVTAAITKAGPFGTFKVDYIPWLRFVPSWMPGAGWKREALESRKKARQLLNEPFAQAKADLISGQEAICMVTTELEALMNGDKNHNMNVDEEVIKNTAATAFTAGAETVVSILSSFFLVLTKFPAVQQRAQEEVDRVLGGRLPTIEDRERLPLIQSMVYELLRWNPVTPIGLPHYASEMDTYGGYTIPEGTTVIPNLWRMLHDPVAYPEPNTFKIDRFLNRILANETHVRDKNARERAGPRGVNSIPDAAIFGAGRRACPGKYIAHDFIFLMVTSVLVTFQVTRAVNEAGQEIDPNPDYTPFLGSHPGSFPCVITPRSLEAVRLIQENEI